jgi:hypothetical protein
MMWLYIIMVWGFLCLGLPFLIIAYGIWLFVTSRNSPLYGLSVGMLFASWCTVILFVIPYAGLYPNLPGVIIATLLGTPPGGRAQTQICVVTSYVLWPVFSTALFSLVRGIQRRATNRSA